MRRLEHPLLREIGALTRIVQTLANRKYRAFGLQKNQFVFLTRIVEQPGIHFFDLSELLKVDKTTTTKAVQKLIEKGYVAKRRDERDKRIFRLWATERAAPLYDAVLAEENRAVARCFDGFTEDEKTAALRLIRRMQQNMLVDWAALKHS